METLKKQAPTQQDNVLIEYLFFFFQKMYAYF